MLGHWVSVVGFTLISSSLYHCFDMTLAVVMALNNANIKTTFYMVLRNTNLTGSVPKLTALRFYNMGLNASYITYSQTVFEGGASTC